MDNENSESKLILAFLLGAALAAPYGLGVLGKGIILLMAIPIVLLGLFFLTRVLLAGVGIMGVFIAFAFQAAIYWGLFFFFMAAIMFAGALSYMDVFLLLSVYAGFPLAILMAGLRIRKGYDFNGAALAQRFRVRSSMSNFGRVSIYLVLSSVLSYLGYENFVHSTNYMNSFGGHTPAKGYIICNAMGGGFFFGVIVFLFLPLTRKGVLA